ncbi:MAG: hypothetical protein K5769_10570 [Pseudobutyrivibrio sp.]|nr:hypothetical protein [Pseudobutyrivibrio sp.]
MEYIFNSIIHKCKHPIIIGIFALYTIIVCNQLKDVSKYPLTSKMDVYELAEMGETDYILKDLTEKQLKESVKKELEKQITSSNETVLSNVIAQLEEYGVEELRNKYRDSEYYLWVDASISNAKNQYDSIDNINNRIMDTNDNLGYQVDIQKKYITYSQAVWAFILIAYIYFFINDNQKIEIIETKKIIGRNRFKYYIYDLFAMLIPCIVYTYLVGVILNFYSYIRFKIFGFNIKYSFVAKPFFVSFVPTIMVCMVILIVLYNIFKDNFVGTIPLYLAWVIMNITPKAFRMPDFLYRLIVLERLDGIQSSIYSYTTIQRIIILIVSIVMLGLSYLLRKERRSFI